MVPPIYAGPVLLNNRTYPIRISSNKYISECSIDETEQLVIGIDRTIDPGTHLTWDEMMAFQRHGKAFHRYEGDSGPGYPDQEEITWEQ
jgi:hypothetical protein